MIVNIDILHYFLNVGLLSFWMFGNQLYFLNNRIQTSAILSTHPGMSTIVARLWLSVQLSPDKHTPNDGQHHEGDVEVVAYLQHVVLVAVSQWSGPVVLMVFGRSGRLLLLVCSAPAQL